MHWHKYSASFRSIRKELGGECPFGDAGFGNALARISHILGDFQELAKRGRVRKNKLVAVDNHSSGAPELGLNKRSNKRLLRSDVPAEYTVAGLNGPKLRILNAN
jgi:hypothetical protein